MKIGEGKENLSEERFSFPSPNPTPSSSKTFDCIESLSAGVRMGRKPGEVSFLRKGEAGTCSRLWF